MLEIRSKLELLLSVAVVVVPKGSAKGSASDSVAPVAPGRLGGGSIGVGTTLRKAPKASSRSRGTRGSRACVSDREDRGALR